MSKQIVYSANLKGFFPVIWYGKPVYEYYDKIRNLLSEYLGTKYSNLLSEVHITEEAKLGYGKAFWFTDIPSRDFKPLKHFNEEQQSKIKANIAEMLQHVESLSAKLKQSENKTLGMYAELLLLALEIPGEDYIYADRQLNIVFVCWGFANEQADKTKFKLKHVLPAVNISKNSVLNDFSETDFIKTLEKKEKSNSNNINGVKSKRKSGFKIRYLFYLMGLLLLLFAIYYVIDHLHITRIEFDVKEYHGKIKPIDPNKIKPNPDDPYHRLIVSNRLNIAIEKTSDLNTFANVLLDDYQDKIAIVYTDTMINFIQIEVIDSLRTILKQELKHQYPEIKLVWDETLFQNAYIPNDPAFDSEQKYWYLNNINAFRAWDSTRGDSNVVIAVIDDGFDLSHPEFDKNIVSQWNVNSHSVYVHTGKTEMFHGTHVASCIAGNFNNESGLSGVAPQCKLMPIQVGDTNGNIAFSSVICGVLYAIHKDADIINISLGMNVPEQMKSLSINEQEHLIKEFYKEEEVFWKDLFEYTNENNITVVIAAGNSSILAGIDPMHRSDNVIVVGAIDSLMHTATFSNFGNTIDIYAPGVRIYNAIPDNSYEYLDGTSMASPIVAGSVALIKSIYPNIPNKQVKSVLIHAGKPLNITDSSGNFFKSLDLYNSLIYADSLHQLKQNDTIR